MLKKLRVIFSRRQKVQLIILAVMILIGAFLELLGVSSVLPVANVMMDADALQNNELYQSIMRTLGIGSVTTFIVLMCGFVIVIYVVKNVYLLILFYVQTRFTQSNSVRLSGILLDYYLQREYLYFTEHNVTEIQRNIINDVQSFFSLVQVVIQFLIEVITCFVLLSYIFITDYETAIMMVLLIGIPIGFCIRKFKKELYKTGEKGRQYSANSAKWLLQALSGVKEVKATNKEDFFSGSFLHARWKEINNLRKSMLLQRVPRYVVEVCCIAGMMIIISLKVVRGSNLADLANTLVVIVVAAARMMPAFNRITECAGNIMYHMPSLDAVYKDICILNSTQNEKMNSEITERLQLKDAIHIRNLGFSYPKVEKKIFTDVNIEIKRNTSIALIGSSGAGKTTMADILLGLLEPCEGTILVDGEDMFQNLAKWRNSIAYIPQSIYLTDDTIRNNVAFGQFEGEVNDEKVWEALRMASLEEFVKDLEDGIDTMVGDRGIRLSGGQRQRIGIARALYRDPAVLLMDEATSALDQETETAIMESIENLHGSVTMIIIAHRLTTIQKCDVIYELKDGVLREKSKEEVFGS